MTGQHKQALHPACSLCVSELERVHKIGPPGRIHKIGSPAGRFKAELNIWHELELGFWCCVKLHTQFQVTPNDATSNSRKTRWKSVTSPLTDKNHSRRESGGFVWLQLRAPSLTFGLISATTFGNFGTIRVVSSRHTYIEAKGQPLLTHIALHTRAVIQTWRLQAISWQDHRVRKAYTYATFIEAGMVATHGAPRHSTNNRISFLDQDARSWNYIRLQSTKRLLSLHNQQLAGAKVSQLHTTTSKHSCSIYVQGVTRHFKCNKFKLQQATLLCRNMGSRLQISHLMC